jgi:hypothetical protein
VNRRKSYFPIIDQYDIGIIIGGEKWFVNMMADHFEDA